MAVKIVRVLNTNAVVSSDQEGRELIITGAGIGFKKKKGENLDEALADKTYYLESVDDSRRLQEVVKEISEEYLEIVSRIVKTAREEGLKVRDSLYVTLTDHINSAVDRYRENIALKNMMKLEIRKFYPKEYEIGLRAVQWIQEQNDENLGEDEAAFIAMHIVSAELGSGSNVDVMKERILEINPDADVEVRKCFYLPENAHEFPFEEYSYVVDAVDTVTAKIEIIMRAKAAEIPVISCMGAGNKLDASAFQVADIYKTKMCPLAKVMRRELKARGVKKLKVVYSEEKPVRPLEDMSISCRQHCVCPPGTDRKCTERRDIPGSIAFVPSVAGLILAGEVVKDLTINQYGRGDE